MGDQLEIVLRNSSDQERSFFFEIHDSPIAEKWKGFLEKTLQAPHRLEKNFCFLGFIDSSRSVSFLSEQLNSVADRISSFVGEGPWKHGYPISERVDPSTVDFSRLNQLHHHFEILIGQTWSASPYYICAPLEIRNQIQRLNFLVHEIEAILHSRIAMEKRGEIYPFSVVSFAETQYRPQLLSDEDYEFFSLNRPFGSIGLHYAQTGKTFLDAWRDNDKEIGQSNINSLRYYSGQFTVNWGNGPKTSEEKIRKMYKGFFDWLEGFGFSTNKIQYFVDKKGQKQGIGWIEVASLKDPQTSIEETQKTVGEYNDLWKIRLHLKDRLVEKEYAYRIDTP